MTLPYQETWIKGDTVDGPHQRPCAERWEIIREHLASYRRPFSLFDLGANLGYFSLRAAAEFDCTSILVDRERKGLRSILERNDFTGLRLNRHMDGEALQLLSGSERFDTVLAMAVLHHIEDWPQAILALRHMAEQVIVEIPSPDDVNAKNPQLHRALYVYFEGLERCERIAEVRSHVTDTLRPVYRVKGIWQPLTMQSVDARERKAPPCRVIVSSTAEGKGVDILHETGIESRNFIPGMNLWNWKLLGGAWPDHETVRRSLIEAVNSGYHDDPQPWNFIINREGVHSIDSNNKPKKKRGLRECLATWDRGRAA